MKYLFVLAFLQSAAFFVCAQNPLLLKDIYPGTTGSNPTEIVRTSGYTFFNAEDDDADLDNGLYRTDGTTQGTIRLNLSDTGYISTLATKLTRFGNKIVFAGDNLKYYGEIWVSDGTQAGTRAIERFQPTAATLNRLAINDIAALDTVVLYGARNSQNHFVLKSTNGTPGNNTLVYDFGTLGSLESQLALFKVLNNVLYFIAYNAGTGVDQLWRSDGTTAGTYMLKDFTTSRYVASTLMSAGNTFYIMTVEPGVGNVLWKSDGTANGTVAVKTIGNSGNNNYPANAAIGNTLYFAGLDNANGKELWKTDGTAAGTFLVADINAGTASSNPGLMTVMNNQLFFTASNSANGNELWKYNGISASLVKDINPGPSGSNITSMAVANNRLVFGAMADNNFGNELWISDGSTSNTVMIADIAPGAASSTPLLLQPGNPVYFTATVSGTGRELYKYDDNAGAFTPHYLYVNNNSTAGDIYTTAIGNNSNSGSASAPLASIQLAVNRASSGDTVFVDAGTYTEQVNISKGITIIGTANYSTIVRGPSTPLDTLPEFNERSIIQSRVLSADVNIKNLVIEGDSSNEVHSILIQGGGEVSNCVFRYVNNGIYFRHPDTTVRKAMVTNNRLSQLSYVGFNFAGSNLQATVINNEVNLTGAIFGMGIITGGGFPPINPQVLIERNKFIGFNGFGISNGFANALVNQNSFSRVAGKFIENGSGSQVKATCNWYGMSDPDTLSFFMGNNIGYTPWLINGIDTDTAIGFQPQANACSAGGRKYYVNDSSNVGDFYTSNIGSNSNNGTAAAPFYSIDYALSQAQAGDSILVDAGTFAIPLTFSINKSITLLGTNYNISPNNAADKKLPNTNRKAESIITQGTLNITADHVFIKGFKFSIVNRRVINSSGARNNFEFSYNYIYRSHTTASNASIAFTGPASTTVGANNLRFIDNRFEQNDDQFGTNMFLGGTDNLLVDNNAFINNDRAPRRLTGINVQAGNLKKSDRVSITNNYIHQAVTSMAIRNASNVLVTGNTIIQGRNGIGVFTSAVPMETVHIYNNTLTNVYDPEFISSGVLELGADPGPSTGIANAIIRRNTINQDVSIYGGLAAVKPMLLVKLSNRATNGNVLVDSNQINITGFYGDTTTTRVNSGIQLTGNHNRTSLVANELNYTASNGFHNGTDFPSQPVGIYLQTDDGQTGAIPATASIEIKNNKVVGFPYAVACFDPVGKDSVSNALLGYGHLAGGAVVNIVNNSFTGNTYSIYNGDSSQVLNANCNWHGSANTATVAQKVTSKTVRYTPFLGSGTDVNAAIGFQPGAASCISINSFSPGEGVPGNVIVIKGFGFTGTTSVKFNGVAANNFSVTSDSSLVATVPTTAATGTISVTTPAAMVVSAGNFIIIAPSVIDSVVVCPGSNAVVVSNVKGAAYQWQMFTDSGFIAINNGAGFSGTQTDTLRLLNVPSAWNGTQFRCRIDGAVYSPPVSLKVTNYWTGNANNNDWNDPLNWGCSGQTPDVNTNVIISSGAVTLSAPASAQSIWVQPGASFTVQPGVSLTIKP